MAAVVVGLVVGVVVREGSTGVDTDIMGLGPGGAYIVVVVARVIVVVAAVVVIVAASTIWGSPGAPGTMSSGIARET